MLKYNRPYTKTIASFFGSIISLFVAFSIYSSYEKITRCTDFDNGTTDVKFAATCIPLFSCIFLLPPIFISLFKLDAKSAFIIDIWSLIGSVISFTSMIICIYCIVKVPNGIVNIETDVRIEKSKSKIDEIIEKSSNWKIGSFIGTLVCVLIIIIILIFVL